MTRAAPFVLLLLTPALLFAQAKTEATKTVEPPQTKTEKEDKAEAKQQVADEKKKEQKKKTLSDAKALAQVDEQVGTLAEEVAKYTGEAQLAADKRTRAQAKVGEAEGAAKTLQESAAKETKATEAAEKAASEAEAKAKAKNATDADKAAAKAARAKADEAKKVEEATKGKLKQALETLGKAKAELKQAEAAFQEAETKRKEAEAKLKAANEGREAQRRWMATRHRADLPLDELDAFLKPLTKAQLKDEAGRWLEKVQSKVAAIAASELWLKRNRDAPAAEKDERNKSLVLLQDDRAKLIDRARAVLKEYESKGGDKDDAAKKLIEEYERYLGAVSGLRIDATDSRATAIAIYAWIKSDEGGVRWGLNLLKFVGTLLGFWILGLVAGKVVGKALGASKLKTSQMLLERVSGMIRKAIVLIGGVVALSMLEVNINPLLAALGGAAIVVGLALQGTLANFASGLLIMGYRPFDQGHTIEIAGVKGKVSSMTMLSTTLITPDNQQVIIPNNSVWNANIVNITGLPTRRVDLTIGIGYEDDIAKAEEVLRELVTGHAKVLAEPAPVIKLHELADSSVNFVVRPWCKTGDYWDVYWDLTRVIKERFDEEGISFPYPQRDVHMHQVAAAAT